MKLDASRSLGELRHKHVGIPIHRPLQRAARCKRAAEKWCRNPQGCAGALNQALQRRNVDAEYNRYAEESFFSH
jgi:hypothetical protein